MNHVATFNSSAASILDAHRLSALSQCVLGLHRGSHEWRGESFGERACELVAQVLPFGACLWGSTAADAAPDAAPDLHSLITYGVDAQALANCLQGRLPPDALSAGWVEPLSRRRVQIHLWRAPAQPAFVAADQHCLDFLLPHLVEARRENRLSAMPRATEGSTAIRRMLLCNAMGALQQADEAALALLRVEWPRWIGPDLPVPLVRAILQAPLSQAAAAAARPEGPHDTVGAQLQHRYLGKLIRVRIAKSARSVVLELRRRDNTDRLSSRQRDVAALYGQGFSGPQIAVRLGLTPSTISNHLGLVFKKLGVNNKLQLVKVMAPELAPLWETN